jgi:hypothetical protein
VGHKPYGLIDRIEGRQLGNGRMVGNEVRSKNNEGQAQDTQQILPSNSRLDPCVKTDFSN